MRPQTPADNGGLSEITTWLMAQIEREREGGRHIFCTHLTVYMHNRCWMYSISVCDHSAVVCV